MKVTRYTAVTDHGLVEAYLNIYIEEWGLHLNDLRVIKKHDGGHFIGYPGKKYEKHGETKYAPYFSWDKESNDRFQSSVKKAIEMYLQR